MKFGLSAETVAKIKSVLKQYPTGEPIIYGSRAKGTYRPGSDIDLVFKGGSLDAVQLGRLYLQLEDLNLPYTFDLSIYEEINNPELLAHIDRVGHALYETK